MDPKEIKAALKEAREALKNKDFKTATRLCKLVLKSDRNNYSALVFFGASLQESDQKDQAPKAFKKAIEVAPHQITAWQGLGSYYEKEEPESPELPLVYKNLLSLESDLTKFTDICKKVSALASRSSLVESCADVLIKQASEASEEKKKVLRVTLVSVLTQQADLSSELSAALETVLENIVRDNEIENNEEYYKKYLRVLYKNKKNNILLDEARNMHTLYPNSEQPLEWICKVYSEQIAQDVKVSNSIEDKIEEYYTKLIKLNPESSMALLAKGAEMFKKNDFMEACETLKRVLGVLSQSSFIWLLLSQCYLAMHCYSDAEHCVKEALKTVKKQSVDDSMLDTLLFVLVKSLSSQSETDKLTEAVEKCRKILESNSGNTKILECLTRAFIMLGKFVEAEKCLNALQKRGQSAALLTALLLKKQNKVEAAIEHLENAIKEEPNVAELCLELGRLHWEQKNYDLSLTALLRATKLDPSNYECYVYLGHYYSLDEANLDKARRCYQKAFRLNPNCKEAGAGLSDIYRRQKKVEANIQLLTYVTETVACADAKWAWLRLGLHHIEQENHQEAIDSLLSAIRADPTDSHCWESLADAYYGRGAYTAALKSYQRVLELSPDAIYPAFQMATIKQLVGSYEEAIEQFQELLMIDPSYVPALKGLGDTWLCLAKSYLARQLYGCAMDRCQESINVLIRAVEQRKDLSCIWKLCGDVCTLVAQLPEKYSQLCVKEWFTRSISGTENEAELVTLDKEDIFQLSVRCYCRALSLNPENSLIWYDLAHVYHLHASYIKDADIKKQLREHGLAAIKKCLWLNSRNWIYWNLLGVIAAAPELQNYRLAQHAFIKAIQLESKTAVTWTNLGTLYLCLNEIKLAHKMFRVAQRTEPSYIECWIGQALIAEGMLHEDTMDLFRHTTQLGVHMESCLGYSHWVCTTLKNSSNKTDPHYVYSIEKMHAIPVSVDSLTWYTGNIYTNPCAYNMLGILLERQQLYGEAAKAFATALALLDPEDQSAFADMVHSNYGRVLVHLQSYEEAIQHYQAVKQADFTTQCGLALALFKDKKYEESYSTYNTALEWLAPTDTQKSHILVALAAMAYMFQGMEESKTLLFQCIQLKPPSVQGLFALCSVGMLHQDLNLSELALKELIPYKDDPECMSHIAVFRAYIHFLQGHHGEAIRALSKMVHRHPDHPSLWLSLALLILHLYTKCDPSGAAQCAQVAVELGRSLMDISKVMSLVSLSHLLSGKSTASLRSSQKAVHMFPDIPENWVVLIASFMPWCIHNRSSANLFWLKRLISYVRRKLEASRQMNQWLSNHERKVGLLAEEYK